MDNLINLLMVLSLCLCVFGIIISSIFIIKKEILLYVYSKIKKIVKNLYFINEALSIAISLTIILFIPFFFQRVMNISPYDPLFEDLSDMSMDMSRYDDWNYKETGYTTDGKNYFLFPSMINSNSIIYYGKREEYNIAGTTFDSGIWFRSTNLNNNSQTPYATWNLNGKYRKMSFNICSTASYDCTFVIYLDNSLLASYNLKHDETLQIELDLGAANTVKMAIYDNIAYYLMYDINFERINNNE